MEGVKIVYGGYKTIYFGEEKNGPRLHGIILADTVGFKKENEKEHVLQYRPVDPLWKMASFGLKVRGTQGVGPKIRPNPCQNRVTKKLSPGLSDQQRWLALHQEHILGGPGGWAGGPENRSPGRGKMASKHSRAATAPFRVTTFLLGTLRSAPQSLT
eukprot:1141221-Pelagomonas_calceolata.AAC.1